MADEFNVFDIAEGKIESPGMRLQRRKREAAEEVGEFLARAEDRREEIREKRKIFQKAEEGIQKERQQKRTAFEKKQKSVSSFLMKRPLSGKQAPIKIRGKKAPIKIRGKPESFGNILVDKGTRNPFGGKAKNPFLD